MAPLSVLPRDLQENLSGSIRSRKQKKMETMATFKPSLAWGFLQNHWETTSSSSSCHDTSSFSSHCYQGNMFCHGLKLKLKRNLRIRKGLGIQGCSCKRTRCTEAHCNVSEDEKIFVEILREAQPCINLLKDSTFVVIFSGEVQFKCFFQPSLIK
jgi:hypothetical protein